ncbi:MAG TPA: histidinol-phosphatase [Actinomycetes bacterium]|nr:histidinol-phosphatase [Actinomycetes bacterium]
MTYDVGDDLALALRLADEADQLSLARFRALDLVIETKPDLTPVSDADRAVETAIRTHLAMERPDDAVLGEEFGTTGNATRRWIVDPIDGTKNYVRGVPVWATLIALVVDDDLNDERIVLGVVSAPALGMRWWAALAKGAWTGTDQSTAQRMQVSQVAAIGDCSVSFSEWNDPAWETTGTRQGFTSLLEQAWRSRAYGDFWSHVLVAEGAIDVAVEPELSTWDMAALVPIVTEAGGRITALDGSSALTGGNAVSSNGKLHDQVLTLLAPAEDSV